MPTWRQRKRRFQRNAALAVLVIGVGALYATWPVDDSNADDANEPRALIGIQTDDEPALKRMPTPTSAATPTSAPAVSGTASSERTPSETTPSESTPSDLAGTAAASDTEVEVTASQPIAFDDAPTSQPAVAGPVKPENEALVKANQAVEQGDLLAARAILNRALVKGLPPKDLEKARKQLSDLTAKTVLSDRIVTGDPLVSEHTIKFGDNLGRLAKDHKITPELLAEINHLQDPNKIRGGQRLKMIHGPFHATVSKSDHMIHLYVQDVYVRSYRVALGRDSGTPTGKWKVRDKVTNPSWVNPRTHERWHPDDPANPIGEFWIGLDGLEGEAVGQESFGIHGTIEPETIGKDVSLGCIRLAAGDIDAVYKLFVPGYSTITVIK